MQMPLPVVNAMSLRKCFVIRTAVAVVAPPRLHHSCRGDDSVSMVALVWLDFREPPLLDIACPNVMTTPNLVTERYLELIASPVMPM